MRQAITSVRARARNEEALTLFAPVLISLLRERRLKHDAREALVAGGAGLIPLMPLMFVGGIGSDNWFTVSATVTAATSTISRRVVSSRTPPLRPAPPHSRHALASVFCR